MIPLQATCFVSKEEIQHVSRQLFAPYVAMEEKEKESADDTVTSFAVSLKRRNCGHFKSQEVISMVAAEAPKVWKVDLGKPDYTVIVEICRTLCGISIVKNSPERFGNFNIMELREKVTDNNSEDGDK